MKKLKWFWIIGGITLTLVLCACIVLNSLTPTGLCTDSLLSVQKSPMGSYYVFIFSRECMMVGGLPSEVVMLSHEPELQKQENEFYFPHSENPQEEPDVLVISDGGAVIRQISEKELVIALPKGEVYKKLSSWEHIRVKYQVEK